MDCNYACRSGDHVLARRDFLGGLAAGLGAAGGLGFLTRPAAAAQLGKEQKRVICIYLNGGSSQLETWDPKPKTDTGGPFRAIPTSLPGLHISELLPKTARVMHHLSLIRSVNTNEFDHGLGLYCMLHGRRQTPASEYPELGAVAARALAPEDSGLPGHVKIYPGGAGRPQRGLGLSRPQILERELGEWSATKLAPARRAERCRRSTAAAIASCG